MFEFVPYVTGFQPERIAHGLEGEKPARIVAKKPILGPAPAPHVPMLRFKLFMKAEKGIFEHGIHQGRLRTHGSELDARVEELFGKHGFLDRSIIDCGSACRPALPRPAPLGGAIGVAHSALLGCERVGVELAHPSVHPASALFSCNGSTKLSRFAQISVQFWTIPQISSSTATCPSPAQRESAARSGDTHFQHCWACSKDNAASRKSSK